MKSKSSYSHVDVPDGEVEPALVVAGGVDGVVLVSAPGGPAGVPDHHAAPHPVGRLEVPGHVAGESELTAERDGLLRLPEEDPRGAGEVRQTCSGECRSLTSFSNFQDDGGFCYK